MFLVLNKEKISAYIVSILTVCFLFFIANNVRNDNKENTQMTSIEVKNEDGNNTNSTINVNNAENKGNTIKNRKFN